MEIDDDEPSIIIDVVTIGSVNSTGGYPTPALNLQKETSLHQSKFKLYTGAQANVLSLKVLRSFLPVSIRLQKTSVKLMTYEGSRFPCVSASKLNCKRDQRKHAF